jgi:hypothetical protein
MSDTRTVLHEALEALEAIQRGEGPYDRDPLTHASNCIEAMQAEASRATARLRAVIEKGPVAWTDRVELKLLRYGHDANMGPERDDDYYDIPLYDLSTEEQNELGAAAKIFYDLSKEEPNE